MRFARVDAELAQDDGEANHLFDSLCEHTKKLVGDDKTEIQAKPLQGNVPAVLLVEEFGRRMEEAQKFYGMPAMGGSLLRYKLVLNTSSPLIGKINGMADGEDKDSAVKYVYDLARLAHGSLSPEDMTAFIKNSAEMLADKL